ncbi:helix-turn-helix transcriptional regulator [Streptomyces sp. NPDC087422]|uniref:helix-turn-helix transcriptional regulator n=1 Tax=Streptomyces sp. NPDC087422 TaxID=3365786 RepID=UPI00380F77B1
MREARKRSGATQQDIADHVGMRQQQIAKLEAGKRGLDLDEAVAIASFFGVTVTEALGTTAASANVELVQTRGLLSQMRQAINAFDATAGDPQ